MSVKNKFFIALLVLVIYFASASFGVLQLGAHTIAESKALVYRTTMSDTSTKFELPAKIEYSLNTQPVAISVPQLNLNLPIELGSYNAKTASWNISDSAAYFAEPTSKLTTSGAQTVLYAHSKNHLFGKVKQLDAGGVVIITDEKSQKWTYALSTTKRVSPNNTDVMYEKPSSPHLVLITCDGIFDEYRKLMYFDLITPKAV